MLQQLRKRGLAIGSGGAIMKIFKPKTVAVNDSASVQFTFGQQLLQPVIATCHLLLQRPLSFFCVLSAQFSDIFQTRASPKM